MRTSMRRKRVEPKGLPQNGPAGGHVTNMDSPESTRTRRCTWIRAPARWHWAGGHHGHGATVRCANRSKEETPRCSQLEKTRRGGTEAVIKPGTRSRSLAQHLGVSSFDLLGNIARWRRGHDGRSPVPACRGPYPRAASVLVDPVNPYSSHGRRLAPFCGSLWAPLFSASCWSA